MSTKARPRKTASPNLIASLDKPIPFGSSTSTDTDSPHGSLLNAYWGKFTDGYFQEEFSDLVAPLATANPSHSQSFTCLLRWVDTYLSLLRQQQRWETKQKKASSCFLRWLYSFVLSFIRAGVSFSATKGERLVASVSNNVLSSKTPQSKTNQLPLSS